MQAGSALLHDCCQVAVTCVMRMPLMHADVAPGDTVTLLYYEPGPLAEEPQAQLHLLSVMQARCAHHPVLLIMLVSVEHRGSSHACV